MNWSSVSHSYLQTLSNKPPKPSNLLLLKTASIMDRIGNSLFNTLWKSFLQRLRYLAVAGSVADPASLLVRARVVDRVWKFVFELFRSLSLDRLWDGGVAGVRDALALVVLACHFERCCAVKFTVSDGSDGGCAFGDMIDD
jgi:hypothetical protein